MCLSGIGRRGRRPPPHFTVLELAAMAVGALLLSICLTAVIWKRSRRSHHAKNQQRSGGLVALGSLTIGPSPEESIRELERQARNEEKADGWGLPANTHPSGELSSCVPCLEYSVLPIQSCFCSARSQSRLCHRPGRQRRNLRRVSPGKPRRARPLRCFARRPVPPKSSSASTSAPASSKAFSAVSPFRPAKKTC